MATVVAFHAHPDDEVLLTGGTLARLAAEGHRTIVVVACCGGLGQGVLAGPVRVLEGTAPRETVAWLFAPVRALGLVVRHDLAAMRAGFTPRAAITHRIDVRRFAAQKQAALAAHRTAVYGRGRTARLFRLVVRLPVPVFGLVAGREWYAEPGARTARPIRDVLQPAGPAQGPVRR